MLQTYEVPLDSVGNVAERIAALLPFVGECRADFEALCREKVYEVVSRVEAVLENVSSRLGGYAMPLAKLGRLKPLIAELSLDESWMTAIVYLQSLEIAVNKLIKELGVQVDDRAPFKTKFKTLIEWLSEKNKIRELAILEKRLPEIFWDLRNKVVHAGYSPKEDELNTITKWTTKIIEKLLEARSKTLAGKARETISSQASPKLEHHTLIINH